MNRHTPVVFTDDPATRRAAQERHWAVVERRPDNPTVLRIAGVSSVCSMPQPHMSIADGSLEPASTAAWNQVLDWLAGLVHKPLPVVAANDYATELAQWAATSRGWPLGALVKDTPSLSAQAISLFTSADGFFFPDADAAADFTAVWPAPAHPLGNSPLVEVPGNRNRTPTRRTEGVTNVLLTSYHAGEAMSGGSGRIIQWFESIEDLSGGRVVMDLAIATHWHDSPANVHFVPDHGIANLTTGALPLEPWAKAVLTQSATTPCPVRLAPAGLWHLALEKYFEGTADEYDVVICAGGPFGHFDFANYAKRRWYARTILDYREPFANNPATDWEPAAREGATYVEAGWNMNADLVLAGSDATASLLVPGGAETRIVSLPFTPETARQSTERLLRLIESLASHAFDPTTSWSPGRGSA